MLDLHFVWERGDLPWQPFVPEAVIPPELVDRSDISILHLFVYFYLNQLKPILVTTRTKYIVQEILNCGYTG